MMTTTPNPSEEQIERAARAFFREYHGEDIWPELRDDGELDTRSRALAATRVALTAAGVAPQEPSECSNPQCPLQRAHSGPCAPEGWPPDREKLHWSELAAEIYPGDEHDNYSLREAFGRGYKAALAAPVLPSSRVDEDKLAEADVAPQEPNQNETKSGNNLVSLDPEKVAEVIEQMRDRARKERDVTKESLGQFISRALCEAYTEGKLT